MYGGGVEEWGTSNVMTKVQAAVGLVQLARLDSFVEARRRLARTQQLETEAGRYVLVRNWLGEQLVNWGCQLKVQCNAV